MATVTTQPSVPTATDISPRLRIVLSAGIVMLVAAYSIGVISGMIIDTRRIDAVHLALILVAALSAAVLIRPEFFKNIRRFRFADFELDIERVKTTQNDQQRQIQDIRTILPLLIPQPEQEHLFNLARNQESRYIGSHTLRTELRRLRSIGLIRMKNGRRVSHIKSDTVAKLSDYVELTASGQLWVQRLNEIDEAEPPAAGKPAS